MDTRNLFELRILPTLAIARLGSAARPMDNYVLEDDPENPIGFRKITGVETLDVDDATGAITGSHVPETVSFKEDGKFRPVAPFLEVFAVTTDDRLVPLTPDLLAANGFSVDDVEWRVHVANRKVKRRTDDDRDIVSADTGWFTGHDARVLEGHCPNFINESVYIDFGRARFIRPNAEFPGIRLRFTPATGLIYGPKDPLPLSEPDQYVPPPERLIYRNGKHKGTWKGFEVPPAIDNDDFKPGDKFWNETLPPALFAIQPPAPSWLNDNIAVSRGFLDDACDGLVEVRLKGKAGAKLTAAARVTSGPPVVVADSLFVRTLADDLDQALQGPLVAADEPDEVTRARAEDIVRRACETVRFLNVEVMNGNEVHGRPALDFDTMPMEEASDTERLGRPIMSPETADTAAVVALHQQVFAALRGGATPWFLRLLRRPEEVTDYTDHGRRKMPALMIGGDNSYLALTHRMIDTIAKAARAQPFAGTREPAKDGSADASRKASLTPRNLSAQLHYVAAGNPVSSRVETSIGNCCPGLEVDFRAVWRRMFEGIVLREYDNLVVEVESGVNATRGLKHHRLLRIAGIPTMAPMIGPNPLDLNQSVVVAMESNPHGLGPLEWSNALAHVLWTSVGKTVACDFSPDKLPYVPAPFDAKTCITLKLKVRPFFEPGTVLISRALAQPGELTQGLCSPWQNDYRECSCYYWASARPDFVNVEVTTAGRSAGDNWMQIERTGQYVPDDYRDERLVDYDHLFWDWEKWLRVQICGRDAPGEAK